MVLFVLLMMCGWIYTLKKLLTAFPLGSHCLRTNTIEFRHNLLKTYSIPDIVPGNALIGYAEHTWLLYYEGFYNLTLTS